MTKLTHNCLDSDWCQVYSSEPGSSLSQILLSRPTEAAQTDLWGEHRGQANNRSEPSPEQLPQWCSYLTLAWGSPWDAWAGRGGQTACYKLA